MKQMKMSLMILAASLAAFTSGCASGGFQLTREYAGFVNRQHVVLRVVLYILTSIIFGVTLLIDLVVNNTMDFWDGRVSQGTYSFSQDERSYVAQHEIGADGRKTSHIEVFAKDKSKLQDVVLKQTAQMDIEVFIDGQLKGRVSNISELPRVTMYNRHGAGTQSRPLWSPEEQLAVR